ncbi:hypothetical protein HPP92_016915 [Vanilla planifolia]|uniref:Homeobox protein knotted-1-like 3 n=1 Tax=Vanilla planifolia TaxID=51239 RepID=A0A835QH09_VANPL|nr:hypothetical protein HPP92_016915 [Vanilla planifolia]
MATSARRTTAALESSIKEDADEKNSQVSSGGPTRLNSTIRRQQSHQCLADERCPFRLQSASDEPVDCGVPREENSGGDMQYARRKAEILAHPLCEQLLSLHVACLRITTPVDQLPRIDAQLELSQQVIARYSVFGRSTSGEILTGSCNELDQFMVHYVLVLCSLKEQLQQHVRLHAMEAVMACSELEQCLQSLTGTSPGETTGSTMSDEEDDHADGVDSFYGGNKDETDCFGIGPLVTTESERTLMERVRLELKHELKQGYKEKIVDIREEILRKRRAGKLPGETTSLLKAWWLSHSKWPYPTEEDKARLVQETGLQLKQINNWFINKRKRNWQCNPSSSTLIKSKRKRYASFVLILFKLTVVIVNFSQHLSKQMLFL